MTLYLLKAKSDVGYDSYDSFVISSDSEGEARQLCQRQGGDEVGFRYSGEKQIPFWTDPSFSTCEVLTEDHPDGIVIGSFNAG